jgi:hypothetical protein
MGKVAQAVTTYVKDVKQVVTAPGKANFGQLATVFSGEGAIIGAPLQNAVSTAEHGTVLEGALSFGTTELEAGGAAAGVAGIASSFGTAGAAELAPAASAGGGAGGFATPATLTTEVAPDFALAPSNYVEAALPQSIQFTAQEGSTIAAEEAGTSVLVAPPPSSPTFALEPENYVQAAPPPVDFDRDAIDDSADRVIYTTGGYNRNRGKDKSYY